MTDNDKTLQAILKSLSAIANEMKKQTAIWKQINDKTHSWNIPNPDGYDDDEDDEPFDDDLPEMGDTTEESDK